MLISSVVSVCSVGALVCFATGSAGRRAACLYVECFAPLFYCFAHVCHDEETLIVHSISNCPVNIARQLALLVYWVPCWAKRQLV